MSEAESEESQKIIDKKLGDIEELSYKLIGNCREFRENKNLSLEDIKFAVSRLIRFYGIFGINNKRK